MSELNPGALQAGSIFHGRYQVVRCIKAGGMGAVYEVIHLETQRRRALKVMLPSITADPDMRARFKLEATVAANIESEHIVETFDAGIDETTGAPFLVMELLRGEDLLAVLQRRGRLPAEEVVLLLFQAALSLDKTHACGIVHRDLKPDNLFLTRRDDGSPWLKVLDFGIAKVVAQSATARQTRAIGTPVYMSPEQVRGDAGLGPASDLYSLGHIAYTLLVGEAYWHEDQTQHDSVYPLLLSITTQGITEPPSGRAFRRSGVTLPPAFDGWLARATAIRVAQRFPSALDMVSALAEALGVATPSLASAPPTPRASVAPQLQRVPQGTEQVPLLSSGPHAARTTGAVSGPAASRTPPPTPTLTTSKTPTRIVAVGVFAVAAIGLVVTIVRGSGHGPKQEAMAATTGGAPAVATILSSASETALAFTTATASVPSAASANAPLIVPATGAPSVAASSPITVTQAAPFASAARPTRSPSGRGGPHPATPLPTANANTKQPPVRPYDPSREM